MRLYRKLSHIGFLKKSYAFKFLFITFIGIHIPLVGILFFVLYAKHDVSPNSVLLFALLMTLLATAITLYILKKLIVPIELASKSLIDYKSSRTIPDLPVDFSDEAGSLMANIQQSILGTENFINEKHDLMYLLSHDLRTFSGNSQALSKMILEEDPPGNIREYAELIYQSTSQQFHFIESFIRMIKEQDEFSNHDLTLERIDLEKVIATVEDQVAQQLQMKNIRLVSSIEVRESILKIPGDLLIRVLVNLLDNAIKFSFSDTEIVIRTRAEKSKLYITVADKGVGFDAAHKDELFKKFTEKSKAGTANEASIGIGLYLCKKIIERHRGYILAESRGPNQGSTFSIVFEMGGHD
jgi:signal transduction histidine kinase